MKNEIEITSYTDYYVLTINKIDDTSNFTKLVIHNNGDIENRSHYGNPSYSSMFEALEALQDEDITINYRGE